MAVTHLWRFLVVEPSSACYCIYKCSRLSVGCSALSALVYVKCSSCCICAWMAWVWGDRFSEAWGAHQTSSQHCIISPADLCVCVCVCLLAVCLTTAWIPKWACCTLCACLGWRSRRAPGRTGVWLARAAEICSFSLVNASLPLTQPRATASLSHNHSDTISSPLLIFSSPSSSHDLLSFLLCHFIGLLSSSSVSWISALIALFLNFVHLVLVLNFFPLPECSFPPEPVSICLSALHLNSQKATFVLTAW